MNSEELALRLQSIIDTAIDGIITINSKGLIESINKAGSEQFGYQTSELIGVNIKMLMPEPYHSEHDGYLSRYLETKCPMIIGIGREVIGLRKDGTQFPLRLAVSEVVLNDRIIFTGIIHDLTLVKKAEHNLLKLNEKLELKVEERTDQLEIAVNQLLQSKHELELHKKELETSLVQEKELNELKTRFISMTSHEFRTPLSTILSSASLISKYKKEEENSNRVKHIVRIKSAVKHLNGILNDLLSLAKLEEGKLEVINEEIDLGNLISTVIDEISGLKKDGQRISIEMEHDVQISSDPKILKNVLFNLLSNALKYSPEDDHIICAVRVQDTDALISIKDHGCGIPEADQKHLFKRFFRASNVENIEGTGLGLSIVKGYMDLLGGQIVCHSIPAVLTTFELKIPIT